MALGLGKPGLVRKMKTLISLLLDDILHAYKWVFKKDLNFILIIEKNH